MAGLHLNVSKTVVVPLYNYVEETIRSPITLHSPDWGGVAIAGAAKYLGFYVGPGRRHMSWEGPLQKYINRAKLWGKQGLGMLLTIQAYQVYICSVLQFVAQLEPLHPEFEQMERKAVQALFPGPTAWIVPTMLKDAYSLHLPLPLVDMKAVSTAAKVRVLRWENRAEGGLHVLQRVRCLLDNPSEECGLNHWQWCQEWGRNSFFTYLRDADQEMREKLRSNPCADLRLQEKPAFQKKIARLCRSTTPGDACFHLRRRLDKWKLIILPGHRTERAVRILEVLKNHSTPRVQASFLRTVCNGWCTRSRYQGVGGCLFGCGRGEDKLAHFATCGVVSVMMHNGIHLPCPRGTGALDSFLCMDTTDEDTIVARCKGLYALYRLYNGIRHHAFIQNEFQDAFNRYLQEARA